MRLRTLTSFFRLLMISLRRGLRYAASGLGVFWLLLFGSATYVCCGFDLVRMSLSLGLGLRFGTGSNY